MRTAFGTKSLDVIGMTSGRRTRLSSGLLTRATGVDEVLRDLGAQAPILRVVIGGVPIARPCLRDAKLLAERRAGRRRQRDDAVGEQQGFIHVVRHHDDGLALVAPERLDFVLQARAGEGVERAQRFIEQQDLGLHRECAGDGDSLTHAA